jgi:WD40 repeat protein
MLLSCVLSIVSIGMVTPAIAEETLTIPIYPVRGFKAVVGVNPRVRRIAVSSGRALFACANTDNEVSVYDMRTHMRTAEFDLNVQREVTGTVSSLYISPDGKQIRILMSKGWCGTLSASDKTIIFHRPGQGELIGCNITHDGSAAVLFSVTRSELLVIDFETHLVMARRKLTGEHVYKCIASPTSEAFAYETQAGVTLLGYPHETQIDAPKASLYWSSDSAFAPESGSFVCTTADGGCVFLVLKGANGKVGKVTELNKSGTEWSCAALSSDGRLLAVTARQKNYTEIWDVQSDGRVTQNRYHYGNIHDPISTGGGATDLRFTPDGKSLMIGYAQKHVRQWHYQTGKVVKFGEDLSFNR